MRESTPQTVWTIPAQVSILVEEEEINNVDAMKTIMKYWRHITYVPTASFSVLHSHWVSNAVTMS